MKRNQRCPAVHEIKYYEETTFQNGETVRKVFFGDENV